MTKKEIEEINNKIDKLQNTVDKLSQSLYKHIKLSIQHMMD
jgi:tetrahydromethanopterin S-methyltransferase subunit B